MLYSACLYCVSRAECGSRRNPNCSEKPKKPNRKSPEPKIFVDRLTFSEPNCPENFYWDGSGDNEFSEPRTELNHPELLWTEEPKPEPIIYYIYLYMCVCCVSMYITKIFQIVIILIFLWCIINYNVELLMINYW